MGDFRCEVCGREVAGLTSIGEQASSLLSRRYLEGLVEVCCVPKLAESAVESAV